MDQVSSTSDVIQANSDIIWSKNLKAHKSNNYNSIALLYEEGQPDVFGDHLAFVVGVRKDNTTDQGVQSVLHKVEIDTMPNFAQARIAVTHEVLPNEGYCNKIISVNDQLRVAAMGFGSLLPIKRFGPKKTFHSDVRGCMRNHDNGDPICLSANKNGTKLASGSSKGQVVIYDVEGETISYISKRSVSSLPVVGLAYLKPNEGAGYVEANHEIYSDDSLLICLTADNYLMAIDTRCSLGDQLKVGRTVSLYNYRYNSMCNLDSLPGHVIAAGTNDGRVVLWDLRNINRFLLDIDLSGQYAHIGEMKEVVVQDKYGRDKTVLAFVTNTQNIGILDGATGKPLPGWTCDRLPEHPQLDLVQVGDRVITCGKKASIGCWTWDHPLSS